MINYIEKGHGLHDAIRAAGYHLSEENGVWVSDNDEEVQKIIDAYIEPLPEVPDVTPRQLRIALIQNGISLETIDTIIKSLPEPAKSIATVEWEYALFYKRRTPMIDQIGGALGLTTQQMDNLWIVASSI